MGMSAEERDSAGFALPLEVTIIPQDEDDSKRSRDELQGLSSLQPASISTLPLQNPKSLRAVDGRRELRVSLETSQVSPTSASTLPPQNPKAPRAVDGRREVSG